MLKSSAERARKSPIEQEIARRGISLRRVGGGGEFIGPCPKCGGTDRFSINTKENVWNCRQCKGDATGDVIGLVQHLDGCTFAEAVEKLSGDQPRKQNGAKHHNMGRERPPNGRSDGPALGPIVATYDYTDEAGTLLFQVTRHDPKDFRQRRPNGNGGWISNTDAVRVVPYRLPDIIEAIERGKQVLIVEGEKDVDRLWSLGYPATTNPRGAGNWNPVLDQYFSGASVVVIGDNDPQAQNKKTGDILSHADGSPRRPGQDHAKSVAERLNGIAKNVRLIDLKKAWPECPLKGDISDYIDAGLEIDDLLKITKISISSKEFMAALVPPRYLIKGFLQRGYLYSLTAATGNGKTAITLLLAICVSQGSDFANLGVKRGSVLYFAGENPHDIRCRWAAVCQHAGVHHDDVVNVMWVPGVYKFSEIAQQIADEMRGRELSLVIIDTSAAYFEGEEENSNTQVGEHARRLRQFINLDGGPAVIVNCHPVKHVTDDNLLPRGGGAFIAEVDGNLTVRKTETALEMHWQGKFRGPEFSALSFQLESVTHELLKDEDGDLIRTVIAKPLSEQGVADIHAIKRTNEEELLILVASGEGGLTTREMAVRLGWTSHQKVARAIKSLERDGVVRNEMGEWEMTSKGERIVSRIRKRNGDANG